METEHLLLRKLTVNDCYDMYEYACREDVTRYLTWNPHRNVEHTREYLRYMGQRYRVGSFYDWALIHREKQKMIGTCGFTSFDYVNNGGEIGYVLNPEYWNLGLATEAAKLVLSFGFGQLGLHRIEARYMEGNDASRCVMEKLGMKFEGIRRGALLVKGNYRNIGYCAILKEEFLSGVNNHVL